MTPAPCDPFPEHYRPEFYHPEPEREMALKALTHLITYTHLIPWITGPEGVGKSVLLQRLHDTAPRHWRAFLLTLTEETDEAALLAHLLTALDIRDAPGGPLYALQETLEHLEQNGDRVVVLIDQAHHLSPDALRLLTALAVGDPHLPPRLHAVLAGHPPTPIQIEALRSLTPPDQDPPEPIKRIPLTPFDEAQTRAYLQHRLHLCGEDLEARLGPADITAIHQASGGLPGAIDRLARSRLEAPDHPAIPRAASRRLPLWPLLLFPVLAILLWPDERRPTAPQSDTAISRPLALPSARPHGEPHRPSPPPQRLADSEPAPASPSPAEGPTPLPAPQTTPAAPRQPPAPTELAPIPAPSPPPKRTTLESALKGPAWLLQRDPSHYTLQLISTPDRQALIDFARRHRLEGRAAYYAFPHRGRTWYALVLGDHPDRAGARAARERLPKALRSQRPWILSFEQVQGRINKTPGVP